MDTRIAVISIIVEDADQTGVLNDIIHEFASYVIGRMGIPYREKKVSIISLVLDAPQDITSKFSGRIGRIPGITAKVLYQKKKGE